MEEICKKQKESINKLIRYIAIKENKDFEEIIETFDIYIMEE